MDTTLLRCCERFSLECILEAGIYGDAASNHFFYDSQYYGIHSHSGTRAGNVAFVGEIGLCASYQVAGAWSLVAGYELLCIDNVALAYEQPGVNTSPLAGAATAVRTGGDVFYYGAILGIEYRR